MYAINFPEEICTIDSTCIICLDAVKYPVLCPGCKQSTCFDCIQKWITQTDSCPKCRRKSRIDEYIIQKERYSCAKDGWIADYYCEQCNELCCRNCLGKNGPHYRHRARMFDLLMQEIKENVEALNNVENATDALSKIRALVPRGDPHEFVRQRIPVERELAKFLPAIGRGWPQPAYNVPGLEYSEFRFYVKQSDQQVFLNNDVYGNQWKVIVYRRGYSDAQGKFLSLYLELVRGTPARYEYMFQFYGNGNYEPISKYFAVDDLAVGTQTKGCQRLISITEANEKFGSGSDWLIACGVRLTDLMYGLKCAAALSVNIKKKLDYKNFSFTLHSYSVLQRRDKIIFSEPAYDQQNIAWRLRIDTNGHEEQGQHLSAYLVLLNGTPGWYEFYIKLIHPTRSDESIRKEFCHFFEFHSSWGVSQFVDQIGLQHFLINDQLKFEYGMRPARSEQERFW
ncbi:uncharacterized protein LOC129732914 [Wyeomyia smithii]|uniref:uncharacterized protein LOC129732914 n=1 Tax=Wyeomyia smithii TaxID=174621 RepID=UPI0024680CCF|nr:uncharacterized protein LOC129732914 [Wyeomyia smithii]